MKILIILIFSFNIFAANDRYLARSPKALLMGDAYTSAADDEFTLYYNPAILARNKGLAFWAINVSLTATNILDDPEQFESTGSSTSSFADSFFDSPIHVGLNAAPGFKLGRFGFTAIINNQTNMVLQNKYTPMLDIDHHYDTGFITGYGFPINGDLAVGLGIKYIKRESVYGTYNLVSSRMIDAVKAGDFEDLFDSFGKVSGSGWGLDLGLDYVKRKGDNLFTMGFSLMDAYTNLHTDSNDEGREVQAQPLKANFGTSYLIKKSSFGVRLAADLRNLEDSEQSFSKRLKLGTELILSPVFSAFGGLNSGQYSYGIKLNLGVFQTYAGLYGIDTGEKIGQQVSRRGVIYLSLFDFNYEI